MSKAAGVSCAQSSPWHIRSDLSLLKKKKLNHVYVGMAHRPMSPLEPSRKLKLSSFDQQPPLSGPVWANEEEAKDAEKTLQRMAEAYSTLIECVSDGNPARDGLKKTPVRAAKALCFFTKGYEEDVASEWSVVAPITRTSFQCVCGVRYRT